MNKTEIFDMVKKWCMKEQVFKMKLPEKDKVEYAIELSYPFNHPNPVSIAVVNPKDRDFLLIQIRIRMSPKHVERMKEKGIPAFNIFYHKLRKIFLEKDVTFRINQARNEWIASDQIHHDGLTQHEFFKTIRRVYNAVILGNITIDEVISMAIIKTPVGGAPPSSNAENRGNLYS